MATEDKNWKIDKTLLTVSSLSDIRNDRAYWMSKTPDERFEAIELMRQINYGYDPVTERLQRVLEVDELGSD